MEMESEALKRPAFYFSEAVPLGTPGEPYLLLETLMVSHRLSLTCCFPLSSYFNCFSASKRTGSSRKKFYNGEQQAVGHTGRAETLNNNNTSVPSHQPLTGGVAGSICIGQDWEMLC